MLERGCTPARWSGWGARDILIDLFDPPGSSVDIDGDPQVKDTVVASFVLDEVANFRESSMG
ncbi:MAG: hypothetical protein ABI112_15380 [Terracoccus sp.]